MFLLLSLFIFIFVSLMNLLMSTGGTASNVISLTEDSPFHRWCWFNLINFISRAREFTLSSLTVRPRTPFLSLLFLSRAPCILSIIIYSVQKEKKNERRLHTFRYFVIKISSRRKTLISNYRSVASVTINQSLNTPIRHIVYRSQSTDDKCTYVCLSRLI